MTFNLFSNLTYSVWFFGIPFLAFLVMILIILRRRMCSEGLAKAGFWKRKRGE